MRTIRQGSQPDRSAPIETIVVENSKQVQPIFPQPIFVERVWGADRLEPWFSEKVSGKTIGEVWLTAATCLVDGKGTTLENIVESSPAAFGDVRGEGFPLLLKILFPQEKLSVQVHPNDRQAQSTLQQPRGKTECWYILSAEPGATVAVGFRATMSKDSIRRHIEEGTIEGQLRMIPVKAGDMVFVDAGTVHAIGPGMVVLETQQYSDVTYRLWDYGRPRELHIEAGMAVTRPETLAGLVTPRTMPGFDRLVECAYFTVDRFRLPANSSSTLAGASGMQIVIALTGGCSLQGAQSDWAMPLVPGHAAILPAGTHCAVRSSQENSEVIRVLQPQP